MGGSWKFKILKLGDSKLSFGVAQAGSLQSNFGFDKRGWGWGFEGTHFGYNSETHGTSKACELKVGDIVTATLTPARNLSFEHNGEPLGSHPRTPKGDILFPAVSCGAETSVKLVSSKVIHY